MKITRPPDAARVRYFSAGCGVCGCGFEFSSADKQANVEHKGPGEDWLYVNCPGCNTRIQHRLPHPPFVELQVAPPAAKVATARLHPNLPVTP